LPLPGTRLRPAGNLGELAGNLDSAALDEGDEGDPLVREADGSPPPASLDDAESYVEQLPLPALAGRVRTVWVEQSGPRPQVQRNLPTGGVEVQCPLGGLPRVVGPLTRARVQLLPPSTTVVGARFWPGSASPLLGLPVDELVDLTVELDDVWRGTAVRLGELLAGAPDPETALDLLQRFLSTRLTRAAAPDRLVSAAVRRLMPWQKVDIGALSKELTISESQLRRRFLPTVGVAPKALQRTLRFQGYLALAQAAAGPGPRTPVAGVADLAAEAGYADHAHLSRECRRLTGLAPTELLGGRSDRCGCRHDHAASYGAFLGQRRRPVPLG
jgi:AraC-like DNA-binding protein